jgi:1-acyl-sn-glycerol-3-phosphate acyltransferase
MVLLQVLISAVRWVLLIAWTLAWILLVMVGTALTLNRELGLFVARAIWAPVVLAVAGVKLEVDPLPQVDWRRPHIYAMNHQSQLDIPCAIFSIPANLHFVAKHSLAYVPFLGQYMWMAGMILINRSHREKAMRSLRRAGERIRKGSSILVYPEGTRSRDGRISPFKKGPFVLAEEARVPIVPLAIEGTGHIMGKGGFFLVPGRARVRLGNPISTEGKDRDLLLAEVQEAVLALHREIGGAGGVVHSAASPGMAGLLKEQR